MFRLRVGYLLDNIRNCMNDRLNKVFRLSVIKGWSMEEIGRDLNITRSRVYAIRSDAITRIRKSDAFKVVNVFKVDLDSYFNHEDIISLDIVLTENNMTIKELELAIKVINVVCETKYEFDKEFIYNTGRSKKEIEKSIRKKLKEGIYAFNVLEFNNFLDSLNLKLSLKNSIMLFKSILGKAFLVSLKLNSIIIMNRCYSTENLYYAIFKYIGKTDCMKIEDVARILKLYGINKSLSAIRHDFKTYDNSNIAIDENGMLKILNNGDFSYTHICVNKRQTKESLEDFYFLEEW